ncbi:hypothetical protein [Ammoniphilus oxalaticus]|nr:hypothetical protein [Ammoniphilus oxalaticus]
MSDQNRLMELMEKGKKKQLNNKELLEMIGLLGPEQAMKAIRNKSS